MPGGPAGQPAELDSDWSKSSSLLSRSSFTYFSTLGRREGIPACPTARGQESHCRFWTNCFERIDRADLADDFAAHHAHLAFIAGEAVDDLDIEMQRIGP